VTADDWSLFEGGNPAPGDPGYLRGKADIYRALADSSSDILHRLTAIARRADDSSWRGAAAAEFRSSLDGDLLRHLDRLRESCRLAEAAVGGYARLLDELAIQAAAALQRARAARAETQQAEARQHAAQQRAAAAATAERRARVTATEAARVRLNEQLNPFRGLVDPTTLALEDQQQALAVTRADNAVNVAAAQRAQHDAAQSAATAALRTATAALDNARREATNIAADRLTAERRAVAELEAASAAGIQNRGLLAAIVHDIEAWVVEHITFFDTLGNLGHWLAQLGTLLSFIPVLQTLGGVLLGLGLALEGVSLLASALCAVNGRRGWGQVGAQGLQLGLDSLPAVKSFTAAAQAGTAATGTPFRTALQNAWGAEVSAAAAQAGSRPLAMLEHATGLARSPQRWAVLQAHSLANGGAQDLLTVADDPASEFRFRPAAWLNDDRLLSHSGAVATALTRPEPGPATTLATAPDPPPRTPIPAMTAPVAPTAPNHRRTDCDGDD
jgi:hypothetical protein